ncbi:MAG: hypothetical protein ACHQYP_12675 [Nitrospiria bacterium]
MKSLTTLRKSHKALRSGTYARFYSKDGVYLFIRKSDADSYLIGLNADEEARTIDSELTKVGKGTKKILLGQAEFETIGENFQCKISPRSGVIIKL